METKRIGNRVPSNDALMDTSCDDDDVSVEPFRRYSVDEALTFVRHGPAQMYLLFILGIGCATFSANIVLMSYLEPNVRTQHDLTGGTSALRLCLGKMRVASEHCTADDALRCRVPGNGDRLEPMGIDCRSPRQKTRRPTVPYGRRRGQCHRLCCSRLRRSHDRERHRRNRRRRLGDMSFDVLRIPADPFPRIRSLLLSALLGTGSCRRGVTGVARRPSSRLASSDVCHCHAFT